MKYLLLAVALLVMPQGAAGCGPFIEVVQFTRYHSTLPGEFTSGHVGVIRPHFWRESLILAYRSFSGLPPDVQPDGGHVEVPERAEGWLWIEARKEVPGVPSVAAIKTEKKVPGADYQFYTNCLGHAFEHAAATLRDRIAKWGAASPQVAEWVRGQDQVFENCSAGPAIPQKLPSAAAPLAADREYQIAAAEFYAGQYDKAEADFDSIASDKTSSWHAMAPYLAARACIRHGTVGGSEAKLREAATRLRAVIDDPARKPWHAPAQELLGFVLARTDPGNRLVELGNQLMQPTLSARALDDYTKIWDRMENASQKPPLEKSDLADWVASFQSGGNLIGKWRSKRTLPWLVAALVWPSPADPKGQDPIAAARAVRPDSPAYATVTYYGILREIKSGQLDAAREWADHVLGTKQSDSATNLLRAERLSLARDWTEFLRFAPREPVAVSYVDVDTDLDVGEHDRTVALDADATQPFNTIVPLKLWIDAATNGLVPRALQGDIAQAAWVRAIILRDQPAARTLAERVGQLKPELAAEMRAYLAERDPAAANFFGVLLMLRGPGLGPAIWPGFGRKTPVLQRDAFLWENWWTLSRPSSDAADERNHQALYDLYPDGRFGPAGFLSKEQRSAGEQEWAGLVKRAGNSVNYLCSEAIAWARAHPQDPRVPQALHLAVQATHYGPADKTSSAYSKQAFDLLHRQYPTSEWTARTKYWY